MTYTSESAAAGASAEVASEAGCETEDPGSEQAGGASEPPEPELPESPEPPRSKKAAPASPVDVAVRPGVTVDVGWLRTHLAGAVAEIRTPPARVSLMVTDDAGMSDLHERHRRTREATDVLSFPAHTAGEPVEADVVVNADEAGRQATARGHRTERELLLYALHGVLHCTGFDDHTTEDAAAMHAEEDRILRAIGVGPTYAAAPRKEAPP